MSIKAITPLTGNDVTNEMIERTCNYASACSLDDGAKKQEENNSTADMLMKIMTGSSQEGLGVCALCQSPLMEVCFHCLLFILCLFLFFLIASCKNK